MSFVAKELFAWRQHRFVCSVCVLKASLFAITLISVILGAALPLVLERAGVDPSNASTTIQVNTLNQEYKPYLVQEE